MTERRTKDRLGGGGAEDWWTKDYPDRERIVLVMDNLNTHHPSSLYEAFDPGRDAAYRGETGDTLHAEAWQLAEPGRKRIGGAGQPVPGPPDSQPGAS